MTTDSLVLELQQLASTKATDVTDLLRKALVVARKLKLKDFDKWIGHELHGYGDQEVPRYRVITAELKAHNPFHGLIPFIIPKKEISDLVCVVHLNQPIEGVVSALGKSENGFLTIPLAPQQVQVLMEMQGFGPLHPVRTVSSSQLDQVVDGVRNTVLEWALRLEAEGILGEGMTFSEREKEKASAANSISIQNFQGILGDVSGSSVQQTITSTVTQGNWNELQGRLDELGLPKEDIENLKAALKADDQPKDASKLGTRVAAWLGSAISKAAGGSLKVGVAVASKVLPSLILSYYGLGEH